MALRLAGIGKPVIAEPDADVQLQSVGTLTRGDCLMLISSTGQSAHLRQLARQARKAGATVISITSQLANPVATLADIRLFSVSDRVDDAVSRMVATTSQQHVMDLVFLSLVPAARRDDAELRSRSAD
jgi:DNA-binding MurR/RpiR family transcriptional regulator